MANQINESYETENLNAEDNWIHVAWTPAIAATDITSRESEKQTHTWQKGPELAIVALLLNNWQTEDLLRHLGSC